MSNERQAFNRANNQTKLFADIVAEFFILDLPNDLLLIASYSPSW